MSLTTRLLLLGLFGLAALFLFWFSREGWRNPRLRMKGGVQPISPGKHLR